MNDPALLIFVLTYAGVALGRIPGLLLDRTGIALLGAIAMIVSGAVPLAEAVAAIDLPTIILLYALMVISAQLRLGGFYTRVALAATALLARPGRFLLTVMASSAALSALLANDIVCLAFTPVLTVTLLRAGRNPLPFLLGLAAASNIGSAATIIGNPQNMLIGQFGRLDFAAFFAWCAPPTLLALAGAYGIILYLYRHELNSAPGAGQTAAGNHLTSKTPAAANLSMTSWGVTQRKTADTTTASPGKAPEPSKTAWPAYNRWQSGKGLVATGLLVALFFTPIPRELSAITIAGLLLLSRRMRSRHILELIDWHLITLFCALFIVIHGIEAQDIPHRILEFLAGHGFDPRHLLTLTGLSAILSNLVSNVPAAMLLVRFLDPAQPTAWYTLAAASTFAGNLIVIGSIANLIVIEQARRLGVTISFWQHARAGIPLTLFSLLTLAAWIVITGP